MAEIETQPKPEPIPRMSFTQLRQAFQNVGVKVIKRAWQSVNFITGISGWYIGAEGNVEFNDGIFRGTFSIGGTLVTISDIALLQSTIDTLGTAGGGTVSLVPNMYTATGSYTVPSGVTVEGNGSTIDFGGNAYQFLIQGSNAYSTGTLSVNYGSGAVVGVGTTWTAGMVGQSILIADYWYTITARTDNTHITIQYSAGNAFMGTSVSGVTYVIATTVDGASVNNIELTNSSTTALRFRYVNSFNMNAIFINNSAQAIDGDDGANVNLQDGYIIDDCAVGITYNNVPFCIFVSGLISNITAGTGLDLTGVTNTALNALSIQAVTGVGTKLTNCANFGYEAFSTIECSSHGIEFVSGNNDVDVLSGYINSCAGDGIKLTATTDRCTFVACSIINNTGYGIDIAASTCDNNQIISPAFSNNTAGNILDGGTNTTILPAVYTFMAAQNLTAGMPVGISNLLDNNIAKALPTIPIVDSTIPSPVGATGPKFACPIGGDKFVYITYNTALSDTLFAQVGSIDRATQAVTLGTPFTVAGTLTPNSGINMAVCKLDTDKFIVMWLDDSSTTVILYRVGTVSGTTISFAVSGTTLVTAGSTAVTSGSFGADFLSTDKFVFYFKTATTANSKAVVCTVSGNTVTAGTTASFGTNSQKNTASFVKKIATDKFVVVTMDAANSVYAQVGTCTGTTTITFGSEVQISTATSAARQNALQIVSPATDVFVVTFPKDTVSQNMVACTVSGTTPSAGSTVLSSTSSTSAVGIYAQSASVIYGFVQGSTKERAFKMTLSGNTLTDLGTAIFYNDFFPTPTCVIAMDNSYFVVAQLNGQSTTYFVQGMALDFLGFVQATVSRGSTANVLISGVDSNQSGLAPGAYYQIVNGALSILDPSLLTSLTVYQTQAVKALSATQVII